MNQRALSHYQLSSVQELALKRKQRYVDALRRQTNPFSHTACQNTIRIVAESTNDSSPPSSSTCFRWLKEAMQNPAKLSDQNGKGSRGDYSAPENREAFSEVVDDYFLRRNPLTPATLWKKFEERFDELVRDSSSTIKKITERTFRTWLGALNQLQVIHKQQGARAAAEAMRSDRQSHEPVELLDRVEIDAIHINLWHQGTDYKIRSKIIVYMAIDVSTRMITGFYVQVDDEDKSKYLGETLDGYRWCILNSIEEKEDVDQWPARGLFSILVGDSVLVLTSNAFDQFAACLGICIKNVAVGKGWHKPFIERFFGTLRKRFLMGLEGYIGKRNQPTGISASVAPDDVLTIQQFKEALHDFIVDDYHHTPHAGLGGKTPYEMWCEKEDAGAEPLIPDSLGDAYTLRCHSTTVTLSRHGVKRSRLKYFNQALHKQAVEDGAFDKKVKVTIYFDRNEMGAVTVLYNGVLYEAETSVRHAHGLTEKQWLALTKYEQKYGPKPESKDTEPKPKRRRKTSKAKGPVQKSQITNQDVGSKAKTGKTKSDNTNHGIKDTKDLV